MALLQRLRWRLRMLLFALQAKPVAGGSPEGDDADGDADADADADTGDADKDADSGKGGDADADKDADKVNKDDDWQAKARKHERAAKREKAAREKAEEQLRERDDADKTEQEKAVEQARKDGETAGSSEATAKFRNRILKAEVKALAAGKFADPTEAHKLLDLDADELFDDDLELDSDAIAKAIDDYLEEKPHHKATPNGGRPAGDADAGKGAGGSKSLEDMTPEEHAKRKHGAPA